MIQKQAFIKFLVPVLFTAAILALVSYQWHVQMVVWQGGSSPLYRNIMEYPAFVRHGFDLLEIQDMPPDFTFEQTGISASADVWFPFTAPQLRIINSPLPDLPRRAFLSPHGIPAQEFTIAIPIELDSAALASGKEPGIFLGYIGENWEVYFNGRLVKREMHLNEEGQIISRRNWRGVHFPVDAGLLLEGINILAFRIAGDPCYAVTGLYYSSPYYMDDYNVIKRRHVNILAMALCGIFGFTAVHYLIIFLSIRKKEELYNLYYSISSVLLCVYTLMFSGIVNYIIPNSDITIRLEYISLFIMVPMLGLFIEHFGTRKITKITWGFLIFYGILSLTQIFFSAQYGDDVLMIWSATVLLYFSYVFFYNTAHYIRSRRKEKKTDSSVNIILVGLVVVYLCGIYDVVDILFFHNSSSLFLYSTFVFHIGMAITLSQRFRGMYRQLEQSNIILEEQVHERTLELKEQTAIAQEASQAKSDFLAIMSHEIRSPLNAVIGFSEIELRGELQPSARENITHIHRSGTMLLSLINEILDISKIESGKLELIPAEYETAPLISGTAGLNRIRISGKPVRFVLEISSGFPAKLRGDELRIRQILNNLLSNAIKYTNEGEIKLTIINEKLTNNVLVKFIISDTGIGIRPEDMDRLFENYAQLDAQANRKVEGTGLGLAITKTLAEMMGGGISAESEYGKGSCFTAWILQEEIQAPPIGEECAESLRNFSYASYKKVQEIIPVELPGCRVLIVDDIPENLLVAGGLLKPYGLHIDTAGSGQEAIDLVKQHDYSLIFMDHMMPEMDGVETAARIREVINSSPVPIIAMTANALRDMKEFYLEHGFQDYLTKPVNPQELDKAVKKWIGPGINNRELLRSPSLPVNFAAELDTQRLDRLNHFCFAFASGREIDAVYIREFTAFIGLLTTDSPLALVLAEAGQKEDVQTIREILPAFCTEFKIKMTGNGEQPPSQIGADENSIQNVIQRIKKEIQSGDLKTAGKMVADLGKINLSPEERNIYFSLYDLLLEDKTQKALNVIDNVITAKMDSKNHVKIQ
ncbi:MAG: ATP-binding protein [Treponema sp.]|nr:ATP-binding protein [Treponema sp.]